MEKHEFFKCMELHKRLKEKVKAGIFIGINNSKMTVSITGFRGVRFVCYLDNVPDWIDYDKMVDDIVLKYRDFILKKFLTEKGEVTCLLN